MTTGTGSYGLGLRDIALGLALAVAGCDTSEVVWADEARSPDGYWTVRVEAREYGGFGTNGRYTHVYLFRTAARRLFMSQANPVEILAMISSNVPGATPDTQMRWRDNKTLKISHDPRARVYFQVVKAMGINISVL